MSYSFNDPCFKCLKKTKCTDAAVIRGAISAIHSMPSGVGHLGAGTVTLQCWNLDEKPEPVDND